VNYSVAGAAGAGWGAGAIVTNCQRRAVPSPLCYDPGMIACLLALALAGSGSGIFDTPTPAAGGSPHFTVSAQFRPGKVAGAGEVAVSFAPTDPDVKINVMPAPKLKLDPAQKVLADKAAPARAGSPAEKYLDTTFPVMFPVTVLGAPAASATVKGAVTYYYCSHREGWCRKGTADVDISVNPR
jgi:hypothetical protein